MGYCICEKVTGIIEAYSRYDRLDYDEGTHVEIYVDEKPDRITKRWDGSSGFRDATRQELLAAREKKLGKEIVSELGQVKIVRLMAIIGLNHENRLRVSEGKAEISMSVFRQRLIDEYKNLV